MVPKKLLVLDVNGLLLDTYFHKDPLPEVEPDSRVGNFYVYKRPFCDEFLQFCLDNFTVGVWSSAREYNVNNLVDFVFGELKAKLAFSWHQSDCTDVGLKAPDNKWKPLFLKELSKLWRKVKADLPWSAGDYDASNTLLVDDTPYKAILNPPNTAIFPRTYTVQDRDDGFLGRALRPYLEGIRDAESVQTYVESNPFGEPSITPESPLWSYVSEVVLKVKDAFMKVGDGIGQAMPLVTTHIAQAMPSVTAHEVFRRDWCHKGQRPWRERHLSEYTTDGTQLPNVDFPCEALEQDEALKQHGLEEGGDASNEEPINHNVMQPLRSPLQCLGSVAPRTLEMEATSDLILEANWLHTASIESMVTNTSIKDTMVGFPPPEQRNERLVCCQLPNAVEQAQIPLPNAVDQAQIPLHITTSLPSGEGADEKSKCSKKTKPCDDNSRSSFTALEEEENKTADKKHLEQVGVSSWGEEDIASLSGQEARVGQELPYMGISKEEELATKEEGNGVFYGGNKRSLGRSNYNSSRPPAGRPMAGQDHRKYHMTRYSEPTHYSNYDQQTRRNNSRPPGRRPMEGQGDQRKSHMTRHSEPSHFSFNYSRARRDKRCFNQTSGYNNTPDEEQRAQRSQYSDKKHHTDKPSLDQKYPRIYKPHVRGWQQKQDARPIHAHMYEAPRGHMGNHRDSTNTTGQAIPITNLPQPPQVWNDQRRLSRAGQYGDGAGASSHPWPESDQGFERRTAYGNVSEWGRPDGEFGGRGGDFERYGKRLRLGSVERERGVFLQPQWSGGTSSRPPYCRRDGASRLPCYNRDRYT